MNVLATPGLILNFEWKSVRNILNFLRYLFSCKNWRNTLQYILQFMNYVTFLISMAFFFISCMRGLFSILLADNFSSSSFFQFAFAYTFVRKTISGNSDGCQKYIINVKRFMPSNSKTMVELFIFFFICVLDTC